MFNIGKLPTYLVIKVLIDNYWISFTWQCPWYHAAESNILLFSHEKRLIRLRSSIVSRSLISSRGAVRKCWHFNVDWMISELISVRKLVSPPSRVGPEFRPANAAGLLIASDALTREDTDSLISVFVHSYKTETNLGHEAPTLIKLGLLTFKKLLPEHRLLFTD